MFRKLDNAWRESFVFQDWLVEYAHIENGYNQFGHKAPAFATPDATLEMLHPPLSGKGFCYLAL